MTSVSTSVLRPRCSVFIATSIDGYIARADGSIDWLSAVRLEGEDFGYERFMGPWTRSSSDATRTMSYSGSSGGIPLFVAGGPERQLVLYEARSWPTGLAHLRYRAS